MIKKRTLLSIILIFTGCMEKHNYPEIELVKFHQDLSYYYIIFLSDTDFSTRESPNSTGSYVHCINDKTIYDDKYFPDYSTNTHLDSNIPKDIKPDFDKASNRYIYNVKFELSSKMNYKKAIYCRVFTGSLFGKLEKSQVFQLTQPNIQ